MRLILNFTSYPPLLEFAALIDLFEVEKFNKAASRLYRPLVVRKKWLTANRLPTRPNESHTICELAFPAVRNHWSQPRRIWRPATLRFGQPEGTQSVSWV